MKMYEYLGMNTGTEEGLKKVINFNCPRQENFHKVDCLFDGDREDCRSCVEEFLFSEVPMKRVKREDIITIQDIKKMSESEIPAFRGMVNCSTCDIKSSCNHSIGDCFTHWLEEEIEVVDEECLNYSNKPKYRWQTIKSNEDIIKLYNKMTEYCSKIHCSSDCKYENDKVIGSCFANFLMEKI